MNPMTIDRRTFIRRSAGIVAGASLFPLACADDGAPAGSSASAPTPSGATLRAGDPLFQISLAEWSLHRAIQDGEMTNLEFPVLTKSAYGIDAVEYVSVFMSEEATDPRYVMELKGICESEGVRSLLIMVDREGRLGDPDEAARIQAVENHFRWLDVAAELGCHSIRVNAASEGTWEEQRDLAADGLRRLTEVGADAGLNVIVENHGGLSSNAEWLAEVMRTVDHPRCGTLPDFGNFRIAEGEWYDIYEGVERLMPFAKAVSAKSHNFDEAGNERDKDYERLMHIVLDAGYRGHVGIEYEGSEVSEDEGIRMTQALLERVRDELTPEYS